MGEATDALTGEINEDIEQMRADIEHTRTEMSETLDAIQDKLSPDKLKAQAVETVRGAATRRAEKLLQSVLEQGERGIAWVERNPWSLGVAVLLVGVVLSRRGHRADYEKISG